VGPEGGGLASVGCECGDGFFGLGSLSIPEEQQEALLRRVVFLCVQTLDGRSEPEGLIGWNQHVNERVVLGEGQRMLRNEKFGTSVLPGCGKPQRRCLRLLRPCHAPGRNNRAVEDPADRSARWRRGLSSDRRDLSRG